jgi:hypothetical protein
MKNKVAAFNTKTDEAGNIIKQLPMTAVDADWLSAGQFHRKTLEGDQEAAAGLKRMEETPMVEWVAKDTEG